MSIESNEASVGGVVDEAYLESSIANAEELNEKIKEEVARILKYLASVIDQKYSSPFPDADRIDVENHSKALLDRYDSIQANKKSIEKYRAEIASLSK